MDLLRRKPIEKKGERRGLKKKGPVFRQMSGDQTENFFSKREEIPRLKRGGVGKVEKKDRLQPSPVGCELRSFPLTKRKGGGREDPKWEGTNRSPS